MLAAEILLAFLITLTMTVASEAADKPAAPQELSLEDLMQVEVTSVSKKPQRLANVAAAVHVISAEEIRLSGATSIPEALRLAPGVDATRVSGDHWAVSTRGFADPLANKLLVLVDGRNVFNPAFSGVLWQDFRFPLEDVERIEVIRGPAAAIWGSNGVNGVINIITKSAASTQGGQVVTGLGNVEGGFGRARWGGGLADGSLYYRGYVSAQKANSQRAIASMGGGDGHDASGHQATGLRFDGYLANGDHVDASADFYEDRADTMAYASNSQGAGNRQFRETHRGAPLRVRYERMFDDNSSVQAQASYAHTEMSIPYLINDLRDTIDFDVHHRILLGDRHDFVWGGDYRYSMDTMAGTPTMYMNMRERNLEYYGLFAQDEISLLDTLRLSLGLRLDHNDLTGWEVQPTARLSWNLDSSHTLWGALSKATRAPSRGERGFNMNRSYVAGAPANTLVVLHGDENFSSEQVVASELGLRSKWAPNISTDAVVFRHDYYNLRTTGPPTYDNTGFPLVIANVPVINGGKMTMVGAELSADWRVSSSWNLQLALTRTDVTNSGSPPVDVAGQIPKFIGSLRVSWMPTSDINVDAWLRHTDARHSPNNQLLERNEFSSFDLRVAWRPLDSLEVSLTGKNLIDSECTAFSGVGAVRENSNVIPTCQPRSLIGQARLDF